MAVSVGEPSDPAVVSDDTANIALSAIICTYDRYDLLPDAIASLLRQEAPPGSIEVIVVDNSPDRHRAAQFGQRYVDVANLTYLVEPRPGLSNARNRGVAAARGSIVAFIDDDARASTSWSRELLRAYDAFGGRAGVVGGRIVPRWPKSRPAWLTEPLLGYLSLVDLGREMRELAAGEWLAGCNISFDKSALLAEGGFAAGLGRIGAGLTLLSNDELEITDRIRSAGKMAIYTPNAVVEHVIPPDRLTPSWFRRRAAWQAVSDLISQPDRTPARIAAAKKRLLRARDDSGRAPAMVKHEMEEAYSLVVLLLGCEGEDPAASANDAPSGRRLLATLCARLGFGTMKSRAGPIRRLARRSVGARPEHP